MIFGDSIAWGAWDTEGGWVSRLDKHIKQEIIGRLPNVVDYPEVYNFSSSGETIHGTLGRFEFETEGHRWRDEPFALIFAVGVNDATIENGQPWYELDAVRRDLEMLLEKAKKLSSHIFFVGPTPVEESRTTPVSWGDFRHTNDRIDEFADAYRQVCQELNVPYISLREAFWEHREKLLPDGLHPNDEGHAMIYGLVKSALEEADLLQIVTKESNRSDG